MNALTERLLREGYTPENMPDYAEWHGVYKHAKYKRKYINTKVFETPCGLLVRGGETSSGWMSHLGVDYCFENDNHVVTCPYILKRGCTLCCDALQRINATKSMFPAQCNMHMTDKPFDEARSWKRVFDAEQDEDKERERRAMVEMSKEVRSKGLGFCPNHTRWNRNEQKAVYFDDYDPMFCSFCPNKTNVCMRSGIDDYGKKGNVYYDLRERIPIPAKGLIPASFRYVVTKDIRLFDKAQKMAVCLMTAENTEYVIQRAYNGNRDVRRGMFLNEYFNSGYEFTVENIRAVQSGKKQLRDIVQDLEDIRNGVTVIHETDMQKAAIAKKREDKEEREKKKIRDAEKKVLSGELEMLEGYQRHRVYKVLGEERVEELLIEAEERAKSNSTQLSMFDAT